MRRLRLLSTLLILPISVGLALPSPALALRAGLEGRESAIADRLTDGLEELTGSTLLMVNDRADTHEIIMGEFTVIPKGRVRTVGSSTCLLCVIYQPMRPGPVLLAHIGAPNASFPESYERIITRLQAAKVDLSQVVVGLIGTSALTHEALAALPGAGAYADQLLGQGTSPALIQTVRSFLKSAFQELGGTPLADDKIFVDLEPAIRDVVVNADRGLVMNLQNFRRGDPSTVSALARVKRLAITPPVQRLRPLAYFDVTTAGLEETPSVFMAPNADTYQGPVRVVMKIGGTTTAAQGAIAEGFVGRRSVGPTLKDEPDEGRVVQGFVDVIVPVVERYGPNNIEGVELAAPGWFDERMIQTVAQENIIGLNRISFSFEQAIGDELARRYADRRDARLGPIRVRVVHDGTASGMFEIGPLGTFPKAERLLVVDVGTGIATRMMIDGRPFLGDQRIQYFHNEGPNLLLFAGDPDHPNDHPDYEYVAMRTQGLPPTMVGPTLPNGQSNPWLGVETLEQRTSGPGVARYAAQLAREPGRHDADFASWVADLTRRAGPGGLDALTAAQVGEAALDGNPLARRAIRERMRELGIGLAVFVVESHRLFETFGWPDHIVFGGGVAHAENELFLDAIRGGFADRLARYIAEDYPADLAARLALSKYVAVDETARQMAALFPTAEEVKVYHERLQAAGLEASALDSQL